MAETDKQIRYDLDGYEVITTALVELINQFPRLADGDKIEFSTLEAESGKAMFPISGAIIETEDKDILGNVSQVCLYPFFVVYRASGLSERRPARLAVSSPQRYAAYAWPHSWQHRPINTARTR